MMFNRNGGGRGRLPGFNLVPQHLKKKGLIQHTKLTKSMEEDGPCGILALLLSKDTPYYLSDINQWFIDANMYGEMIGLESMYMKNGDFDKLVLLDGFNDKRIVIFTRAGGVEYAIPGEDWNWPEDLLRTEPDPNSLYLMRDETDPGNKHYWCVGAVKALVGVKDSKVKCCYFCFHRARGQSFDDHQCKGIMNYQCQVCKRNFTSPESLNNHRDKRTDDIFDCECCGRKKFFGRDCYERHLRENCHPPKGFNKSKCPDCKRNYKTGAIHNCDTFQYPCFNCQHEFVDLNDYRSHRCCLQVENKFWDPIPEGKFYCHFGYDFETCREDCEEEDQTEFKHEIMAWCVQLIVPDQFTRQFILDKKFCQSVIEKIESCSFKRDIKPQLIGETIRIRGTSIESFVFLVTEILVQIKRKDQWCPTFWAHNGSRFDAKFLLDYFLNVRNFDLAGATYDDEFIELEKDKESGKIQWKKKPASRNKKAIVNVSMIGSKVLEMKVSGAVFRCSYAHLTAPLRDLPKMFGLSTETKKGEFPYPLLKRENWGKIFPKFPGLELFDVDSMSASRRSEVLGWYQCQPKNQPWNFDKELWEYLDSDVDVLCKVLEAYHQKVEEMHMEIWRRNSDRLDKLVSPLQCSTLPGWSLTMYKTWFMPDDRLVILLPAEAEIIRESLRGGRTDKRCNYMELESSHDQIQYVDFKSLYPSVQKCDIHDTHFPVGVPSWGRFNGSSSNEKLKEDIGDKTGFIRISCKPKKYVTHPTLHRVGSYSQEEKGAKLLFELDPKMEEVYAWPEIEEAIRCDEIEVTYVHEALLFDKGTDVFEEYVNFFFKVKEEGERTGNAGLRSLGKLLLNSLWGKLGQRSYSEREWVVDTTRRDYLLAKFESGEFQMKNCILKDDYRAYFEYTNPKDHNNLKSTACHIAAFVSMWGRVTLHKKLLSQHGMRALYCDTDSAIVYLRCGIDEMFYLGDKLGDLTDEVIKLAPKDFKEPYIKSVVLVAPKTYGLEIRDRLNLALVYHKVVCKGFEPSFTNAQAINFKSFKELVFTQYNLNAWMNNKRPGDHEPVGRRLFIKGGTRLTFGSSLARNEITPKEKQVQKNLNGKYTKGSVHPNDPRFISPYSKMKMLPPPGTFLTDRHKHFD